ncbi:hrcA: heat-inducible transcription repressor HrcA [Rubrobacter radiotolerans]|uniref:Heat-inducible transcription repressor HrcA n=1 Tax=Rubrobacter radiotolerans TaxID=42256 RepID=A0A023X473_RUBRA|nr:heat-inducible transcriptional repressor HrcA [Rubrobacter radiotolerans]AHY46805.1 hrcA: heat-inducible transcription repressor HrcA [Rubrobacter radiotolerans]MDX5894212.1 heat-inducible transcriptional repressor HrcA [Rubrobacter radiotolerans]SMC05479.1 heat-inducible transcription repressor HrcA [Rubrobacter radiotolerans DSM 5868]
MKHPEITARQRVILERTLELYISTGQPVGSALLADSVDASSSTIRAELANLEAVGLLTHPHTSAGRVPTDAGYRFYVDTLLASETRRESAFSARGEGRSLDELLDDVSEGMSDVTRLLAVVAGPSAIGEALSRVDFLPLPERTVLLVVTMESGATSSSTITLPARVEEDELREMFAALNAWLGGRPLGSDLELARAARSALSGHDPAVVGAVIRAVEALGRASERGVFVRGASALLSHLDDLDPEAVAAVVEIFERRRWLLRLMGDALQRSVMARSGIIVSIGAENMFRSLGGTSFVAAAYSGPERPYGVVSLIGPKRMDYDAAITTVRSAAETLSEYLSHNPNQKA